MSRMLLHVAVCVAVVGPAPVFAAAAPAVRPAVRAEVDVDIVNEAVEASVRDDATAWLGERIAAADFELSAHGQSAKGDITATLEIRDFDREQGLGYTGLLTLELPAGRAPIEIRAGCACSGQEFFDRLGLALDGRVDEWTAAHDENAPVVPAPRPAAVSPPVPLVPPRYRVEILGAYGIGAIVLGAGGVAGGAVLWARGVDRGEPPPVRGGDGLAGAVIVGAGALLLAAGVGMVVTEMILHRRWPSAPKPATHVVRGDGLGLSGRF